MSIQPERYSYGYTKEHFHDTFETREAALEAGRKAYPDCNPIYTCRCQFPVAADYARLPGMFDHDVADAIEDAANDENFGFENDPVFDLDMTEIEAFVLEQLRWYLKLKNPKPNGYRPVAIVEHKKQF